VFSAATPKTSKTQTLDVVKAKVYKSVTSDPHMFHCVKKKVGWVLDGVWEDVKYEVLGVYYVCIECHPGVLCRRLLKASEVVSPER